MENSKKAMEEKNKVQNTNEEKSFILGHFGGLIAGVIILVLVIVIAKLIGL